LEKCILIMAEIKKIDDTTVAKVGMEEVRQIYSSTQLVRRRKRLREELKEVEELLKVLK